VPKDPNGGFLDPGGVVHVRTKGGGGVCHAPQGQQGIVGTKADGKLNLLVECWDGAGRFADRAFNVNYTRGGTQKGSLITALMPNGAGLPLNQKVALKGETSINAGTPSTTNSGISVTRTGVGAYTFQMFAGTGPSSIQVTPTISGVFKPGAVCGITGTSVASGIKSTKVQCRGPLNAGPVDVRSQPQLCPRHQYARPDGAQQRVPIDAQHDRGLDADPAGRHAQHNRRAHRRRRRAAQLPGPLRGAAAQPAKHVGVEPFSATAEGSTADCQITSSAPQFGFQQLRVACSNSIVQPTDTAFQLHYAGKQQVSTAGVGRLRLSPAVVTARSGKVARLRLRWTHPRAWRQLRTVEVRLYRGPDRAAAIAFSPRSERIRSRGDVRLIRRASDVTHRGKSVIARLAVRVPKAVAGDRLRVDVEGTDRHGRHQLEPSAGLINVK
jgi:hypothetical protein